MAQLLIEVFCVNINFTNIDLFLYTSEVLLTCTFFEKVVKIITENIMQYNVVASVECSCDSWQHSQPVIKY